MGSARAGLVGGGSALGWGISRVGVRRYRSAAVASAANLLMENLDGVEQARVKPKLVDNDYRLSKAIGSAEEGVARES